MSLIRLFKKFFSASATESGDTVPPPGVVVQAPPKPDPAPPVAPIEPAKQKRSRETGPAKILCIEGRSSLRNILAQLLELGGHFEIDVASNGLEGVDKAVHWQPDVILMGLRMPVMDGFAAITAIRSDSNTANIPIIVISPWSDASSKARAMDAGANEHLTPPVETDRLIKRINHYLAL